MSKIDNILNTATEVQRGWNNKQVALFHYFNPNGIRAQKKITDAQIDALVEAGKAKTGAYIAYGSMNSFYTDDLLKLVSKQRVNRIDLWVTLKGIRENIDSAKQFIQETQNEQGTDENLNTTV
jgi:hypothetical protein